MRIESIQGVLARCEARGVGRDVNLMLLQHEYLQPGDFVMVHVGCAIQKMTPQDATSAWEIYDQMLAAGDAGRA
jgi:hydrogenase expression/formation protein HypC